MYVGLAMTQIELEKIADSFDKDRSGMIDLSAILGVLKGRTQRRPRPLSQETLTDDDKIENEVMKATFCILKTCAALVRVPFTLPFADYAPGF